jgi:hypothetical protein
MVVLCTGSSDSKMPNLSPITLSSLKDGLTALKEDAQPRIDALNAKLASGISITNDDEAWLDGTANFTDEALLIAELQQVGDLQGTLAILSGNQKATAQRLHEAASSAQIQNSENITKTGFKSNPNLKRESTKQLNSQRSLHSMDLQVLEHPLSMQMENHQQRSNQSLLVKRMRHSSNALRFWIGTTRMGRTNPRLPNTLILFTQISGSSSLLSLLG